MGVRNFFNTMIEARERQAQRYVNDVLYRMDDAALKRAGLKRSDIAKRPRTHYPL